MHQITDARPPRKDREELLERLTAEPVDREATELLAEVERLAPQIADIARRAYRLWRISEPMSHWVGGDAKAAKVDRAISRSNAVRAVGAVYELSGQLAHGSGQTHMTDLAFPSWWVLETGTDGEQ